MKLTRERLSESGEPVRGGLNIRERSFCEMRKSESRTFLNAVNFSSEACRLQNATHSSRHFERVGEQAAASKWLQPMAPSSEGIKPRNRIRALACPAAVLY
jgi:hypothetical protein